MVTIEELSTSQDILSTVVYAGLESQLDAGTEPTICNFEEPTAATSDSQLMWEAEILLVLRQ